MLARRRKNKALLANIEIDVGMADARLLALELLSVLRKIRSLNANDTIETVGAYTQGLTSSLLTPAIGLMLTDRVLGTT